MPGSPETIVFLHNPKAGGQTLRRILQRRYDPAFVYTFRDAYYDVSNLQHVPGLFDGRVRLIQGHIPLGLHRLVTSNVTYVTVLRDPIDRIVSMYYYRVARSRKRAGGKVRLPSLEEFVVRGKITDVDNGQCRRLSGLNPAYGRSSSDMLELAKRNLRDQVAVFGLTERFDESVILMRRAFGWKNIFYVKRNVTEDKPRTSAIPERQLATIREYNQLDLELYDYARRLFRERLREQGPDFWLEVLAFKLLNRPCASAYVGLQRVRASIATTRLHSHPLSPE